MDILDFTPKTDTVEVILRYGGEVVSNDDGTEMSITVYLPHSKEAKAVDYEIANRQIKALQKGKKGPELTAEILEQQSLDRLAKLTKEWDITYGGEKPELTIEKAKEVYAVTWIRNLVEQEISDAMDFTQN